MTLSLSYNILSLYCPNYEQMGKWQVLFYDVVKRTVNSEFKFTLLKKLTKASSGLGICNKQSYFFCAVLSMSWGCVPGTHERIIPCSPAGCGCSCLHCVAVTLQMKTDSWELHVENLHGWALDMALHIWAAKTQTCRTFPLARVAALSQDTNIAWGKQAEKGYLQPWERENWE